MVVYYIFLCTGMEKYVTSSADFIDQVWVNGSGLFEVDFCMYVFEVKFVQRQM